MNRWLKARWFRLLGRQGGRFHRFEFALKNLRKSADQEPNNLHTALDVGWCLHKLNEEEAAIEAYERVIQQRPDYASAHACLGLSLALVQRHQEALDELRRAVRMQPGSKDRWYWDYILGTLLAYMERWEEAIEPLRHSIELKPREASTHYWLARAYAQMNHHAEAVQEFKKTLKLCPNEPNSLYAMGWSLGQLSQFDKAADAYKQAIRVKPDYWEALVHLGYAYLELDRGQEALAPLKLAVELQPECLEAHDLLGVAYFRTGDILQAEGQRVLLQTLNSSFEGELSKLLSAENAETS